MNEELQQLRTWIRAGDDPALRALESIALDIRLMRKATEVRRERRKAARGEFEMTPVERDNASRVLNYLNKRAGRRYKPVNSNLKLIVVLMRDGFEAADFQRAVDATCERWRGDDRMDQFLRPSTIFGRENFAQKYSGLELEDD